MSVARRVEPDEEQQICALFDAGESVNAIGRALARAPSTVSGVLHRNGRAPEHAAAEKMRRVTAMWDTADRLELINEGFDQAHAMLPDVKTPRELQHWFTGVAIGVDKKRLETGETTANVGHAHLHFTVIDNGRRSLPSGEAPRMLPAPPSEGGRE